MTTAVATDVHFRITSAFNGKLSERAAAWGVSRHEAARRLAALSNFDLRLDQHDRVLAFAGEIGVGFVESAAAIAALKEDDQ